MATIRAGIIDPIQEQHFRRGIHGLKSLTESYDVGMCSSNLDTGCQGDKFVVLSASSTGLLWAPTYATSATSARGAKEGKFVAEASVPGVFQAVPMARRRMIN
jgi:hypothetical protein